MTEKIIDLMRIGENKVHPEENTIEIELNRILGDDYDENKNNVKKVKLNHQESKIYSIKTSNCNR